MNGVEQGPLLRKVFDAAIAAAQPALCLPPHLLAFDVPASLSLPMRPTS